MTRALLKNLSAAGRPTTTPENEICCDPHGHRPAPHLGNDFEKQLYVANYYLRNQSTLETRT